MLLQPGLPPASLLWWDKIAARGPGLQVLLAVCAEQFVGPGGILPLQAMLPVFLAGLQDWRHGLCGQELLLLLVLAAPVKSNGGWFPESHPLLSAAGQL